MAGSRVRSVIKHVLLIAASFVMIYPLLWLLVSLVPADRRHLPHPRPVAERPGADNYTEGWFALGQPFGHYIINSRSS